MELINGVQNTVRANDSKTQAYGKIEVIDSAKVAYLDLRMVEDKVVVAVYEVEGLMYPEAIQEGYINHTLQDDLNAALDRKDWAVPMAKEPTAVLTAQVVEDGIRIDNIAVSKGERRDNYERVLTEYMRQLSKTLGKSTVTAKSPLLKSHIRENSREAKKYGKEMTFFDKKTYTKYLQANGFGGTGVLGDLVSKNGKVSTLNPNVVQVLNSNFKVSDITQIRQM